MIVNRVFGDKEISFEPFLQKKNVMVNATQMAKIFGKEVARFMENDSTKKFINACLKTRNSSFLNVETRDDLVISRQKSGTWMHRVLALKFAAWLNPDFELWVFLTIEELLYGHSRQTEKSISRTVELQEEKKLLIDKKDKTGDDFIRFLEIEDELKKEKSTRSKATKEKFQEMKDMFEEQADIFSQN